MNRLVLALVGAWSVLATTATPAAGKLELFLQTGHAGRTLSVDLSPDGKYALTGSADTTVILWDAATGKQMQTFRGHKRSVDAVSLSRDGKRVLTGSEDKTAVLWDAVTGKPLQTFHGPTSINSVNLSSDGKRILTGSRKVILWDAQNGKQLQTFSGHVGLVYCVSLSRDGKRVLTGSKDKTAILWDAATGKQLQAFRGHGGSVASVSSSNGKRVLTGSDKTVILWDTATGKQIQTFRHTDFVHSVRLSKGNRVLTGSWDNPAILWDAATGKQLHAFRHTEDIHSLGLSKDGKRLLTGFGRTAIVWDAQTGNQLQTFTDRSSWEINNLSQSLDGQRLVTGFHDKTAILWDVQTRKEVQTFRGHTSSITCVSLSSDGKRVLTGSDDQTAILWDAQSGKRLHTLKGHTGWIMSVSLSSDGKVALTGSLDGTAILWDALMGSQLHVLRGQTSRVQSVSLSSDGNYALTGGADGTTRLWAAKTGKELCSLISIGGKEWLVVTPEGLFDGSINASRFLSYRVAGTLEFVPLERYQHKYYQPGLLALLVKGQRPTPKVDIAKSLPPRVRFAASIKSGMEVKDGKLQVKAIALTRGDFPVKAFRLLIDGRPYRGLLGVRKIASPKPGESTASWDVELEPGRHTLKVMADTEYVQGASDEIEVRYTGGGIAKVELPTLFVLAVGISKYPGTRKLDYAADDAKSIAAAYQKHSKILFKDVQVKVVTDKEAGRKGIFAGLQWLREKMSQKSVGVFFFAGHGEKDKDGSLYFLPVDFEEKDLAGSAIDADVLKKQLAGIPSRLTMILDACHSGDIDKGKKRGVGGLTDQLVRDLTAEESGLVVMCSALGSELAQESHKHKHGLFTVALLEGLAGKANKTPDGAVYLTALDAYVAQRVKELSKGQQNPVTGKPTSVRDFPVSKP